MSIAPLNETNRRNMEEMYEKLLRNDPLISLAKNVLTLRDAVGDGRRNQEEDVAGVDWALSTLDYRPADKRDAPDPFITRGLHMAIKTFQSDNDLKRDGYLKPGGETELALNQKLAEKKLTQNADKPPALKQKNPSAEVHKPNTPEDQKNLSPQEKEDITQAATTIYKKKVDGGQKLASDMLRNYYMTPVDGQENDAQAKVQVKPYVIPSETIKNVPEYKKATDKNNWRFIEAMRDGMVDKKVPSTMRDQILGLKDGGKIDLKNPKTRQDDYWDAAIKRNTWKVLRGDDYQNAVGAANVKSTGSLTAEREGNRIKVQGNVTHDLSNIYDFNDDTLLDHFVLRDYRKAAEKGIAKPFPVNSRTTQKLEAEFDLKDGRLIHRSITFRDVP